MPASPSLTLHVVQLAPLLLQLLLQVVALPLQRRHRFAPLELLTCHLGPDTAATPPTRTGTVRKRRAEGTGGAGRGGRELSVGGETEGEGGEAAALFIILLLGQHHAVTSPTFHSSIAHLQTLL